MAEIKNKVALIILDGWGINHDPAVSAIEAANTPFYDNLIQNYPNNTLTTFGEEVGLPAGQMGNSEVGHMNIGAGRVIYQELVRINKAFKDGEVEKIPVFEKALRHAQANSGRVHVLGLVSDGGVHSHIQHLFGLCDIFKKWDDIQFFIHGFLDGRDTDPQLGALFIHELLDKISESNIHLATIVGRYYAMDRDNRWERTKTAYDLLVRGQGHPTVNFEEEIRNQYKQNITDEFMSPLKNEKFHDENMQIKEQDVVIFFNFRTDRPRQLTEVLTQRDIHEFNMYKMPLHLVTFTEYDQSFENIHVIFTKDNLETTLGQVLSQHGKSQLRIAETEKYPHVTFFFNGGREIPYPGEERIMVPSPKVSTYDLKPEMSAFEITRKLIDYAHQSQPDFICLNYANTDMVGHTGDFNAAIKAAETVDENLSLLVPTLLDLNYSLIILADHGNSDVMVNPDGSPNTAHTTNPVPVLLVSPGSPYSGIQGGKLGDIAPTILRIMKISIPEIMTGKPLINNT